MRPARLLSPPRDPGTPQQRRGWGAASGDSGPSALGQGLCRAIPDSALGGHGAAGALGYWLAPARPSSPRKSLDDRSRAGRLWPLACGSACPGLLGEPTGQQPCGPQQGREGGTPPLPLVLAAPSPAIPGGEAEGAAENWDPYTGGQRGPARAPCPQDSTCVCMHGSVGAFTCEPALLGCVVTCVLLRPTCPLCPPVLPDPPGSLLLLMLSTPPKARPPPWASPCRNPWPTPRQPRRRAWPGQFFPSGDHHRAEVPGPGPDPPEHTWAQE